MLCSHCGHAMLDGFKFCHHCGKPGGASVPPDRIPDVKPDDAQAQGSLSGAPEESVVPEEPVTEAEKTADVPVQPEEPIPEQPLWDEPHIYTAPHEEADSRATPPPSPPQPYNTPTPPPEPVPDSAPAPIPDPEPFKPVQQVEQPPIMQFSEDMRRGEVPSTGKLFFLELICYIPVLNFLVLVFLSASRKQYTANLARGKLLAMMTVLLVILIAVLTLIVLMYYNIVPPIYLGRWRT